jgi:hypothetical protein
MISKFDFQSLKYNKHHSVKLAEYDIYTDYNMSILRARIETGYMGWTTEGLQFKAQ